MTKGEIKNRILEHKECCKKLAEEYRQRYNEDKTDKLALNMFYHNVIAYNNFETILSMIEDRYSMIMCFSEPPILTEKTVEVELNRIAELEKENNELKTVKIPQLERKIASIRGAHSVDCRKLNARTEQVERLKKQVSAMSKALINAVSESDGIKDRLSKAKEIIKRFVELENCTLDYDDIKEAEQFIKE